MWLAGWACVAGVGWRQKQCSVYVCVTQHLPLRTSARDNALCLIMGPFFPLIPSRELRKRLVKDCELDPTGCELVQAAEQSPVHCSTPKEPLPIVVQPTRKWETASAINLVVRQHRGTGQPSGWWIQSVRQHPGTGQPSVWWIQGCETTPRDGTTFSVVDPEAVGQHQGTGQPSVWWIQSVRQHPGTGQPSVWWIQSVRQHPVTGQPSVWWFQSLAAKGRDNLQCGGSRAWLPRDGATFSVVDPHE